MTNNDPEYVRDLERGLAAAEQEIKDLQHENARLMRELEYYQRRDDAEMFRQMRKDGMI